jgi:hypothetical protein
MGMCGAHGPPNRLIALRKKMLGTENLALQNSPNGISVTIRDNSE